MKFKSGDVVAIDVCKLSPDIRGLFTRNYNDTTCTVVDDGANNSEKTAVVGVDSGDFWIVPTDALTLIPNKHVHHDMIVAWAANPSRVVEYLDTYQNIWFAIGTPNWGCDIRYRFADEVVQKPKFPTTSLSSEQLTHEYEFANGTDFDIALFAVANAAIKQYILDCENK